MTVVAAWAGLGSPSADVVASADVSLAGIDGPSLCTLELASSFLASLFLSALSSSDGVSVSLDSGGGESCRSVLVLCGQLIGDRLCISVRTFGTVNTDDVGE